MFAKTIIDTDAFMNMPASTQCLYFHLAMRADDDGFVGNPKSIMSMIGFGEDDLRVLLMRDYILPFDSGVIVIKHWKIHNYIQSDRYKSTIYQAEKKQLEYIKNVGYIRSEQDVYKLDTDCIQNVSKVDTQDRLGKDRLGEDSIDIFPSPQKAPKETRHRYGQYKNVLLTDEQVAKLKKELPAVYEDLIERLSEYMECSGKPYKNHYAVIKAWARKDASERKTANKKAFRGEQIIDPAEDELIVM